MHQPSEGANGTNVNPNIASDSPPTPPPRRVRPEASGYKVLCFDGGGCRGYASLLTLKKILSLLEPERATVFPYLYFDLICGTSTGGLIAILLGVLHLDIKTAIDVFEVFAKTVFGAHWRTFRYLTQDERYPRRHLRRVVAQILETHGNGRTLMEDPELDRGCKCFVTVAQRNGTAAQVQLVRSYPAEDSIPYGYQWTIMDAAMSTAAAPTYFRNHRITVGDHHFFFEDAGAHGANNPATRAWSEIRSNFANAGGPNCFISIGTGTGGINVKSPTRSNHSGVRRVVYNIVNIRVRLQELAGGLLREVADVDGVEETMRNFTSVTKTPYYRFNPPQIGHIPLNDYKAVPRIQPTMNQYHAEPDTNKRLLECSKQIDIPAATTLVPVIEPRPSRLTGAWHAATGVWRAVTGA